MTGHPLGLLPGRVVLKLLPGEAPARPAAVLDVRAGLAAREPRTGLAAVDRVLVRHSDLVGVTRVHAAARSLHRPGHRHEGFDELEHVLGLSRTFVVELDRDTPVTRVAEALGNLHEVEAASPQRLCITPFLMSGHPDRSRVAVAADDASALEPGLPNTTIAVLDTGVQRHRRWFGASLLQGFDTVALGTGDLAPGLQLLGDTSELDLDPDDEVGHGTGTAGIIASVVTDVVPPGLAGRCTVLPVRVLGSVRRTGHGTLFGVGSPIDIDAGMKRAVDLGAKVLNLSFGTPLSGVPQGAAVPHEDVVRYASAKGCVLVAASGNSGREEAYTPAALPGVIAVGAVDQDGMPARFSTRGRHVDVCAPGAGVLTAGLDGPVRVDGTSFAAPFVTAAAALLVSRAARRSHPLDGPAVAELLRATARPWQSASIQGHGVGVLDVRAALAALDRSLDRVSPPPGGRWPHHHDGTAQGRT